MTQTVSKDLQHFLRLARRGHVPGCSTYERYARQLADLALEATPGMDSDAFSGLAQFLTLAKYQPTTARDLIERT